jgi:hypothetical protein
VQEWPGQADLEHAGTRASLVLAANEIAGLDSNIWMGGAHTPHGTEIEVGELSTASFLDLAGDLPGSFRAFSQSWSAFVFPDVENVPPRYERLLEIVRELHTTVKGNGEAAPANLYFMCTHGMNRSGLATGLLLRELGMGGDDAIRRITDARRGALANNCFRELIREA